MYVSIGAGMLRGWITVWNMELMGLLFATALAIAAGITAETVASVRRKHH